MTLDFNAVDPTVVPHFKGAAPAKPRPHRRCRRHGSILALTLPRGFIHRPAYPHGQL